MAGKSKAKAKKSVSTNNNKEKPSKRLSLVAGQKNKSAAELHEITALEIQTLGLENHLSPW